MNTPKNQPAPSGLDAALSRLFHRNIHLVKLDLEPMKALLAALGNPQNDYLCLHVAGTNGKGSVCAMLESILRAQGYRTGRYTSPHLIRFNERIQVAGETIADETLRALMGEVEHAAAALPARGQRDVTFFEFTTALAFLYFRQQGVEVAVLETGMGGRLDATNVVTPAVSVITSIGWDHMVYLGDSLAKIAAEKAGIIKPGRPVVVGALPEEAMAVTLERARAVRAPLFRAADRISVDVSAMTWGGQTLRISSEQTSYGTIHTSLPGLHQGANAALAVAAVEVLDDLGVAVGDDAVRRGLAAAVWPARGQLIASDPPTILDGAHNPEAAMALAAWVKKVAGKKTPVGWVVGFLGDKDPAAFMHALGPLARRVWIVPVQSERAMPVDELARRLAFLPSVEVTPDLEAGWRAAESWARAEGGAVVICGSLYLAGEVLERISRPGGARSSAR
ncbi:MAG TPA: folylpolyglutamate synthase/dihydrofolate synthase family protein [Kiritimatiellia bacterium]|nr:folylpolyglutamate synthase/dihydrofolate synthase family protein [Kiritimatiellia bacterium]HMP35374.1 folylpolyglutamate synthase/dihydrofolate synthase family protein [Kiritimatiellia bacterium]